MIGSPIGHSRSPAIYNAAFAACGLDWVFVAFDVTPDAVPAALSGARALGLRGLSVTMPLKAAVARGVDHLTPAARMVGVVNSVAVGPEGLTGDNTDGAGLLDSMRLGPLGWEAAGRRCVVVGAGGAARAVVWALAEAGAAEVAVLNRTPERAESAARLAGPLGRVGMPVDVAGADLIVNATPVGMLDTVGAGALPLDPHFLGAGQVVVDLVYHPVRTPLLEVAAARGALPVDGVGMLVHQAGRQFSRWTGHDAPLDAMEAAARSCGDT